MYDLLFSEVFLCSEHCQSVHRVYKVTKHKYYHINLGPVVMDLSLLGFIQL